MPENQKKTPCSRLPKRNPDSKPNSDTTPASDGQIQRPEMAANGREIEISEPNSDTTSTSDGQTQRPDMSANDREIEISELTFRQQAALPGIALAQSLAQAAMPMCLSILADAALEIPDPALRLRAARYLLSYGVKFVEVDNLKERLKAVEDAFHYAKTASPGIASIFGTLSTRTPPFPFRPAGGIIRYC